MGEGVEITRLCRKMQINYINYSPSVVFASLLLPFFVVWLSCIL